VTMKYLFFVLRADNDGEGGVLALMALVHPHHSRHRGEGAPRGRRALVLISLGLFGAALLYGDGIITPAISVLSAMEGLEVVKPALSVFVVPLTIAVLIGLFLIQRHGTARVGSLFAPIMVAWFITIAALGLR